ncbi:C40 family peptidase [Actinoallomurus iriomotensis]|uniref:Hydrolase Nlp/P60 n=1 Tax=Actinoallomurus iriomotensis TaxID=478107 RepID=A0A9W6RSW0_9ACTN|nr:C40 family peptidase [Actinoallomurus iriomotensis]GLY79315.1 hydrolase Nlp/P60 [Actinoallomurus iriomotensis]
MGGITYDDLLNATPHQYKSTADAWGKWRDAVDKHGGDLLTVNQHVSGNWDSAAASEAHAFIDAKHLKVQESSRILAQVESTLTTAYTNFAEAHNKLVQTVQLATANGFDCTGGKVTDTRPPTDTKRDTDRATIQQGYQDDIDAALKEATSADSSVATALRDLMPGTDLSSGNGTGPGNGHGTPLSAPVDYAHSGSIPVPANASTLAPNPRAQQIINWALTKLGDPYVWGAAGPDRFDCSGLTSQAYHAAGIDIPRTSDVQWQQEPSVPAGHEQPGDLVFFHMGNSGPGHVGIVLDPEKGTMIVAPHTGSYVQIQNYKTQNPIGFARPT